MTAVGPKSYLFLALSSLAIGASRLCHFRLLKLGGTREILGIALIASGAVLVATSR